MATAGDLDYETALHIVERWQPSHRLALLHAILRSIAPLVQEDDQPELLDPAEGLRRLRGIGANGEPPPSDEDVKRILGERRMAKYG